MALCLCLTRAICRNSRGLLLPADSLVCVLPAAAAAAAAAPAAATAAFLVVPPPRSYEGEFQVGYAHGLGQMTSVETGEVFLGEFFAGQRHG